MKSLLLMISLCLCGIVNAKTYYVSTTGNNANSGSILQPFKTWDKLSGVMVAGDVAYIRGGIYYSTKGASACRHINWENMIGQPNNYITIQNYPGESPIFDCSNIGIPTCGYPWVVYMTNTPYVKVKGLRVRNLDQIRGDNGYSRGWLIDNSDGVILENCEVDHMGGAGFILQSSDNVQYINCDSHHNADPYSTSYPYGGSDGFACSGGDNSTNTTYTGCRAWLNSDDGWDNFKTDGVRTWNNCWAFWNGYTETSPGVLTATGDGNGFKLGPADDAVSSSDRNTILRFMNNCLAFNNSAHGFDQNGAPTMRYQIYNSDAYNNGGIGFDFGYFTNYPGVTNIFKNNVAFQNVSFSLRYCGANGSNTNNTWTGGNTNGNSVCGWKGGMAVSSESFQGVDTTGVAGARQADGSLPNLNFLKLADGSNLINAGVNVGLAFNSTVPDLGAFEFGNIIVPVTLIDFTASEKSGKTFLQWATVTEINSSHFELERSSDGRNFETIGTVIANGNTNTRSEYKLFDNYPENGINFYRLKIIDIDGQFEYSKTVSIIFKNTSSGSIEIKSALINNKNLQLNFNSTKSQSATIGLYDAIGREIFVSNILIQKGMNVINKVIMQSSTIYYFKLKSNEETKVLPLFNGE